MPEATIKTSSTKEHSTKIIKYSTKEDIFIYIRYTYSIYSISSQQDKFYPLCHFHSISILQTGEAVKLQIINDLTISHDTVEPPN